MSVDSAAKNKAFAQSLNLTYPVLSDESKKVSEAYGVLMPMVRLASRTTFMINKQGVIQDVQSGGEAIDPSKALATCSLMEHRKEAGK